jgi:nucleoid DNA-binding protein
LGRTERIGRQYLTGPEVKKESGRVPSFMSFIADKD